MIQLPFYQAVWACMWKPSERACICSPAFHPADTENEWILFHPVQFHIDQIPSTGFVPQYRHGTGVTLSGLDPVTHIPLKRLTLCLQHHPLASLMKRSLVFLFQSLLSAGQRSSASSFLFLASIYSAVAIDTGTVANFVSNLLSAIAYFQFLLCPLFLLSCHRLSE